MAIDRRRFLHTALAGTACFSLSGSVAAQLDIVLTRDNDEFVAGDFSVKNDTWGRQGLRNGTDYSSIIRVRPDLFPDRVAMEWSWPPRNNVSSYLSVTYRPLKDAMRRSGGIRLDHIDVGTVDFDVEFDADDDGYFALSEGFIYENADLSWPPVAEIGVFFHPLPRFTATISDTVEVDGYACGIVVETKSADVGGWDFVKISLPEKRDTVRIDLRSLFDQLKAIGLITGREYFSSWKTGVETLGGRGSLVVHSKAVSFSASRKLALSGRPPRLIFDDEPYEGFVVEAHDGSLPYRYSLTGDWPPGIEIDQGSGRVSGQSTAHGRYENVSIEVVDGSGSTARLPTFSVAVGPNTRPVSSPVGQNYLTVAPEEFGVENAAISGIPGLQGRAGGARFAEQGELGQHKFFITSKQLTNLKSASRLRAQAIFKAEGRNVRFQLASQDYSRQVLVSFDLVSGREFRRHAEGGWIVENTHAIDLGEGYFLLAVDLGKGDDNSMNWIINLLADDRDRYDADGRSGVVGQNFFLTAL